MDMEELWSKTREVLRAEVNAVVYNSLLGSNNLVPALLDGDTLVLRVVMDNLKLLITNQWYSTIVRARPLKRAIQKYLEDEMAEMIIRASVGEGDTIVVDFDKDKQEIVTNIKKSESAAEA